MNIKELHGFLRRKFPQVADEVCIEALDEGSITMRLRVSERHLRPGGTLGGPSIFLLGDVAAYCVILAQIGPEALTVTTSAAIDFLGKPPSGSDLLCRAEILKLGRVLVVVDARFFTSEQSEPVARANFTYFIPPRASI